MAELGIVLVSGGMDSLLTAAIAYKRNPHLAFLHLNYGQKTQNKEFECFHKIADFYNIPARLRKVIDVSFLKQIGGSSLTDDQITIKEHHQIDNIHPEIPDSYVPFRNTHIVAMAVSWAEVMGAKRIYIGAVFEDSSGYPDCRPKYYEAYNKLIQVGTKDGDIRIETPVIHMKKNEIVLKCLELKAPIHDSWSCYARGDQACGICDSCALRLRGFQVANIEDPIEYLQRPNYLLKK